MNQEEKNKKLAEHFGWTDLRIAPDILQPQIEILEGRHYSYFGGLDFYEVPNYFQDLNAIHELWLFLPRVSRLLVVAKLADMINLPKGKIDEIGELEEALFSATAAQRCEAIGKTLELW